MASKRKGIQSKDALRDDASGLVVRIALLSRAAVLIAALVSTTLGEDYDTSTSVSAPRDSSADGIIRWLLGGLSKWDAVYNLRIAEAGYEYEQYHGFFPGLPLATRAVARSLLLPLAGFTSESSRCLIAGVLVTNLAFIAAAWYLYQLGRVVLRDEPVARTAALLFCINPANIFFSAVYTESPFALFAFAGMYYAATDRGLLSVLAFAGASSIRGNGLINVGFIAYYLVLQRLVWALWGGPGARGRPLYASMGKAALVLVQGAVYAAISVSTWAAFQVYAYRQYCTDPNRAPRPWCADRPLPLMYSFVQRHYWHNGLFAYYQVKNIPNFFIAFPILALSVAAVYNYFSQVDAKTFWSLGLDVPSGGSAKKKGDTAKSARLGLYSPPAFVHVVYMAALTLFAVCLMYIQCSTRFLCASCPALFWYAASLPARYRRWVVLYFAAFNAVGIVLFTSFYPWT